jgi:Heavy metal binding domain
MIQEPTRGQFYFCPMHTDVRQPTPGKCAKCGMDLVPEGTSFGMLRHIFSRPMHLVAMAAVMLAVMAAVMMMR